MTYVASPYFFFFIQQMCIKQLLYITVLSFKENAKQMVPLLKEYTKPIHKDKKTVQKSSLQNKMHNTISKALILCAHGPGVRRPISDYGGVRSFCIKWVSV